jgi:enoyl-CoA hydratase
MSYQTILVEKIDRVALIKFNRPEALNALNGQVMADIVAAVTALEADEGVGCIVLTGSERAFAAGADIKEMADKSYADMQGEDYFAGWAKLAQCKKPTIAAVSGFALGGGCEVAMMCDFIIAAENAKFGQPEIKLGVIPGIGGTQRLVRAVGKAKAADLCMTGRLMDAAEAEKSGLVARVVPTDKLMDEALAAAKTIASYSNVALSVCKETLARAFESTLAEGVLYERRVFHALFATEDQKEGMAAFVEKRPPNFKHR